MKGLEQQHIGKLKSITRAQTALLPSEENKCMVTELEMKIGTPTCNVLKKLTKDKE